MQTNDEETPAAADGSGGGVDGSGDGIDASGGGIDRPGNGISRREFALDTAAIGLATLIGTGPPQAAARAARAEGPRAIPASAKRFRTPLALAEYSQYFVGPQAIEVARGTIINGTQLSVECMIPAPLRHPWPIVLVHGGGGQGSDWMSTPDGRLGWASLLLEQGYAVYLVDRPGQGRPPYEPQFHGAFADAPTYERMAQTRTADRHQRDPANAYAHLHTQWPGSGELGDPALDQLMAAQGVAFSGSLRAEQIWQERAAMLLDDIGPAILITHADSGAFGWLAADVRPQQVKALIALEPSTPSPGPAFGPRGTPIPSLRHLQGLPVAVVSAEASAASEPDARTVDALRQAGCAVEHLRLAELGIHGNGHYLMMERNHGEILQALLAWLQRSPAGASREAVASTSATAPQDTRVRALPEQAALDLRIAEQGSFWVGVGRKPMPYGTIAAGQGFVQYFIPAKVRHRYPILMIHGGGSQITNFIGMARRPGWLHYALAEGYRVYMYDRPGYGRSPYHPDALGPGQMRPFATLEIMGTIAGAGREWPGSAIPGEDPLLAQFAAGEVGNVADLPLHSQFCARGLNETLDRIGRAVVLTYAAGSFFGWQLANDRPDLVAAILVAEGNGRPFDAQTPWGLTALPVSYDPPARTPEDFSLVVQTMPEEWPTPHLPFRLQAPPVRRLVNLAGIPMMHFFNNTYGPGSGPAQVAFLTQAGCQAQAVHLRDVGFPDNTNVMPLEKNNRELFNFMRDWLAKNAPDPV
ncbi:MAG TPA: alpha/beta fold hydrolase [Steroidobacteraceae bacterium]|nr:alpha/beta fold hydrolase [Steroidobacteraceae bacterium]